MTQATNLPIVESSQHSDSGDAPPPPPSLLRSGLIVSAMTMLSRVLGLCRDVVFATVIGAGGGADAFFVAFKIPNFLRRLFAEGAFSQAFVPVLTEYRNKGSMEAIRGLIDRVCGCLGLVLLLVTFLAVAGAPVVATLFAPGFRSDPEKFSLVVEMIRITFPYLFLISMTGFAGAVLNSYQRFVVPAFTPVFLNLTLIFAALVAAPWFNPPVMALAWGVFAAGIMQLMFQVPFLMKLGLMPRPKVDWHDEGVRRILKLMLPAIFGVSVSQINLLLDTVIASFLPTGSVSWLYYSDRLMELPLGVFGIAIATVIMPSLSGQHVNEDKHRFAATLDWAVRAVALVALPAALALTLLAEPILTGLFRYGETTSADITMSSYSLQAYSVGLLAFMLIKVLAPGFYARQDTATPVRIGIIAMVVNMGLNLIFVYIFHVHFGIGHVGLALATAGSAFLNAGMLWLRLKRDGVWEWQPGWGRFMLQITLANTAMGAWLIYGSQDWRHWADARVWERGIELLILCGGGAIIYAVMLLVLGWRPAQMRHD